jgi:hypothetical protein
MFSIPYTSIPKNKKPTYLTVVSAYQPKKLNPQCICWIVGGDCFVYGAADLTTAKILLNSMISTPDAKFLGIGIKDFYFGTTMTPFEPMHISLQMLILDQYNLIPFIHNNCVYVEIRRGIYGPHQAGGLTNNPLIAGLVPGAILHPSLPVSGNTILVTSPCALLSTILVLNTPTRKMFGIYPQSYKLASTR